MKNKKFFIFPLATIGCMFLFSLGAFQGAQSAPTNKVSAAPNGIAFRADYKNWRMIAPSHRTDNDTIRAILGNDAAMKAARSNKTKPWPDGAVLAKIVWKDKKDANWEDAIVPGKFVHVEFMIKDKKKYEKTGGWGYARWKGDKLAPYGEDASFAEECVSCHTPVKNQDFVFTHPAPLP